MSNLRPHYYDCRKRYKYSSSRADANYTYRKIVSIVPNCVHFFIKYKNSINIFFNLFAKKMY